MASTYSDLKFELIGTGEQSGTWGATTNTNLGTAIEEAISGRATANFTTDADLTLTLTNTNATQVARNYILDVTSGVSLTTTRNLIVPSIDKPYIIENNTTGSQSIVVKTSAGTGVTVPNGKRVMVYANSTNVVEAFTNLPSGVTVTGEGTVVNTSATQTLTNKTLTSPTLTTPVLGTPTSGTLTSCTGLPLTTGVTGTLPVANGGTGITSFGTGVATALGQNVSGSGSIALTTSPSFTTPVLGTPTSGTLTNCTGLPLSGTTGTLPINRGGTNLTSTPTNGQLLIGNGTGYSLATLTAGANITITNASGAITIAGVALSNFTEASNTATPNATVPVNSFSATGAATNIDVAIVPKGTGAFSLQVADNTATGGNKRGTNAIDLQKTRSNADRVAFGSSSFVAGASNRAGNNSVALGSNNQASTGGTGTQNGVAIGADNVAGSGLFCGECVAIGKSNNAGTSTDHNSAVAIGTSNNSSAAFALTIGQSNTASGTNATAIGFTNTASGTASSVPGGSRATTNSIQGLLAYGFNGTSLGQNQMAFFGARPITTNNTTTRATADAAAAGTANQLVLRDNSAFRFFGQVVARDTSTNDCKEWEFFGLIKRGANAAATSLVGTPTVTSTFADSAASTWTLALSADTTNGALAIDVTGQTSKTIRWTAVVQSTEVN